MSANKELYQTITYHCDLCHTRNDPHECKGIDNKGWPTKLVDPTQATDNSHVCNSCIKALSLHAETKE